MIQIAPLLAALSFLNNGLAVPRQKGGDSPDPKRIEAIWDSAANRISRQNDIWFKNGDFPRAIQLLRFAWEIDTSDYDAATNLGWMLENVDDYPAALSVYERFAALNPKDPDRTFPEAYYYFEQKQYAMVPPLLDPVLVERPQGNAYRILARSYERMKKYSDSVRVWKAFVQVSPNDGAAKVNLARAEKLLASGR